MIVVAMIFGSLLALCTGKMLKNEGYPYFALLCYMGGILFTLYMASLL